MWLARLFSRLPFPVLYALSDFLFLVSYHVVKYRRKLVMKNLRNSFPEKSTSELRAIEKAFYRNLCDYAVETLKLLTIDKQELIKRMHITNHEEIDACAKNNQSVIALASHQFNWEWLLVSANATYSLPVDFVYQTVKNKFFNDLTQAIRTRFGAYSIDRHHVAREFIKRKNITRVIATVADQYPGLKADKRITAQFLNQETEFFFGSNQMATMSQYKVIYLDVRKIKRGYYTCTSIPIAEPPYDKNDTHIIEDYIRAVEQSIRNHPDGWLWSHNRWKKRKFN